ncbi:hypothetical protein [Streptomyces sparsus]
MTIDVRGLRAADARLCTAADLAGGPRALYEAERECPLDEPSDVTRAAVGYEDWCSGRRAVTAGPARWTRRRFR